jgi:hypothetical protein
MDERSRPRQPLLSFNEAAAETIEAATARIFPSDELGPGAREAGVLFYLDRALAGPYARLGDTYRIIVTGLEAASQFFNKARFADLPEDAQDALLTAIEHGSLTRFGLQPEHMALLVRHTREGMFSDPAHGGNRDLVGWKLLGYPGVHRDWTHEEEEIGAVIRLRPLTTMADDRSGITPRDEAPRQ